MTEQNAFLIRAMYSREEDFKTFFENNVAAVGWSRVDFTAYSDSAALRLAVYDTYYRDCSSPTNVISRKLNEVERFQSIRPGDRIVIPFNSYIVLAEALEETLYDPENACDLSNQRRVRYRFADGKLLRIPRSELSDRLQKRLRVRGITIASLSDFREELDLLFRRDSYSYSQELQDLEQREFARLKTELLQNLQTGNTNLPSGGIGLERLVCDLMSCEGYHASILPKNHFSGYADADILAVKEDAFSSTKILVQVKHHRGNSGDWGVRQLIGALAHPAYSDCNGYFITSAAIPADVQKLAQEHGIEVMDGAALVDLILNDLNQLSETTRRQLGICRVPRLLFLSDIQS